MSYGPQNIKPIQATAGAIMKGKFLNPEFVERANKWRELRIKLLKQAVATGAATLNERHELIWKWGIRLGR